MRGYKVLTADRHSAVIWRHGGGRHYPVGEAVTPAPKHGPLCVFRRKKQAEGFARDLTIAWDIIVVKCRYEPSTEGRVWRPALLFAPPLYGLPAGTALAISVTCLE